MTLRVYALGLMVAGWMGLAACSSIPDPPASPPSPNVMSGSLVSSRTTMVPAWFKPKNPLTIRHWINRVTTNGPRQG